MHSALLALVLATPAPDSGEATEPPPEATEPKGPNSASTEPEPEDPVELAALAEQAFAEGRFEQVVDLAARAYALTGDPRHLYAQALAERRLGHCREALILYARVLARAQDDPSYAALAEGTRQGITLCEQSLEVESTPTEPEPEPEPEPVPPPPEEPEEPPKTQPAARPWYRDPVGGALLAVGLATGAGAGGALWALSRRELTAADRATDETVYAESFTGARTWRLGSIVSFAIGGALVTGAVVRYVLVDREYRRQTAWMTPLPGGLAVGWRRAF